MNKDFKERVFLPVVLPLGVVLIIFAVAFSLSRVLLAIPEIVSTFTALLAAAYILLIAGLVAARPKISSSALGIGMVVGLVAVVAAGVLGAQAGIRDLHPEEAHAEEGAEGEEGEAADADFPDDALLFVAVDIDFDEAPSEAEAGTLTFALDNQGGIHHDVAIDELGDEIIVEADGGQTDVGTVDLQPGSYTYFCTVPGHREAGMEGTLTVN